MSQNSDQTSGQTFTPVQVHTVEKHIQPLPYEEIIAMYQVSKVSENDLQDRVSMRLPDIDMRQILTDLETLFQQQVSEGKQGIYCIDLSGLETNLMSYPSHVLWVVRLMNKYFRKDGINPENGNHVLIYGLTPLLTAIVNTPLGIVTNHSVKIINEDRLEEEVARLTSNIES